VYIYIYSFREILQFGSVILAGPLKLKKILTQTFNSCDGLFDSIRNVSEI
jgi:hypothetical protein